MLKKSKQINKGSAINKTAPVLKEKVYECLICGRKIIKAYPPENKDCSCSNGIFVENIMYKVGER